MLNIFEPVKAGIVDDIKLVKDIFEH